MNKKLIVNADDFGFNSKINKGIIDAHKNGVVTNVSIIVTKEAYDEAVKLIKENIRLEAGIHIDIDRFFEIDLRTGVIINVDKTKLNLEEIKNEIIKQIEILKSTGIDLYHLSSHHNTHMVKDIFELVCEICVKYNIPTIRLYKKFYRNETEYNDMKKITEKYKLITPPHFIEGWYWGNIDEEFTIAELVTHPGYGEVWREYELTACCEPKLKDYLREKNIQLINFKDLVNIFKQTL